MLKVGAATTREHAQGCNKDAVKPSKHGSFGSGSQVQGSKEQQLCSAASVGHTAVELRNSFTTMLQPKLLSPLSDSESPKAMRRGWTDPAAAFGPAALGAGAEDLGEDAVETGAGAGALTAKGLGDAGFGLGLGLAPLTDAASSRTNRAARRSARGSAAIAASARMP